MKPLITQERIVPDLTNNILSQLHDDSSLRPYFVTINFTRNAFINQITSEYAVDQMWRNHQKIHRYICSRLTNNFSKKPYLHPIVYDFADVPGTRNRNNIDLQNTRSFHTHGIWLIKKKVLENWKKLVSGKFSSVCYHQSMQFIESIDAVPVIPCKHHFQYSLSYACKLLAYRSAQHFTQHTPLFQFLPLSMKERSTKTSKTERCDIARFRNHDELVEHERQKKLELAARKTIEEAPSSMFNQTAN